MRKKTKSGVKISENLPFSFRFGKFAFEDSSEARLADEKLGVFPG